MLNKVKIGIVVAAVLTLLKIFFTDVVWTEGLGDAIVLIILFASQFFIKESKATIAKLRLRKPAAP